MCQSSHHDRLAIAPDGVFDPVVEALTRPVIEVRCKLTFRRSIGTKIVGVDSFGQEAVVRRDELGWPLWIRTGLGRKGWETDPRSRAAVLLNNQKTRPTGGADFKMQGIT